MSSAVGEFAALCAKYKERKVIYIKNQRDATWQYVY